MFRLGWDEYQREKRGGVGCLVLTYLLLHVVRGGGGRDRWRRCLVAFRCIFFFFFDFDFDFFSFDEFPTLRIWRYIDRYCAGNGILFTRYVCT